MGLGSDLQDSLTCHSAFTTRDAECSHERRFLVPQPRHLVARIIQRSLHLPQGCVSACARSGLPDRCVHREGFRAWQRAAVVTGCTSNACDPGRRRRRHPMRWRAEALARKQLENITAR